MTIGDWIAAAAVVAAVVTAIIGVVTGIVDRRSALRIAEDDRRASTRQARLMFEWEAAQRLAVNLARGGHTAPVIRSDMGAEALALVALLGPKRVPNLWARKVGKTDQELSEFVADESKEQFLRDAVEAERAMSAIASELHGDAAAQDSA
ncbi:hypothetical protein [Marisediminicola sp. LYQ134]|uniref:hypothetical protein n=1 Tax=Marisediminicola sp. LYQ134 TaxID=3391061 RepID=UPI003983249E